MKFKKVKGFTLLELLIYTGILTISTGLIGGVFYTISKANLRTQVNEELNNQLIRLEEIFHQKIESAKGINSIGGSIVNLKIDDVNKDPTEFTLTDNSCAFSGDYKVTIDQGTGEFDGYAWSDQIGWISFNCKTGGDNQSDICSTSNYKVQDLRLRTISVKVDITVQYNSEKPELAISRTNTFVFNIIT